MHRGALLLCHVYNCREFWMTVDNPFASDQFKVGQEWYLNCELAQDVT